MAVESWIDALAKRWEFTDGKKGTILSYRLFERDEFPESLPDLNTTKCALTYVTDVEVQYSAGGPCIDLYKGTTEFHLTADLKKSNLPYLLRFISRIRDAAAGSIKLGGTVDHFVVKSITGPMALQYGDEALHHGFVVEWEVKENVSGDFTVSA